LWEAKSDEDREMEDRPLPKYTDNTNKAFKYGGWNEHGITRFNELTGTLLPALRKSTAKVETQLLEHYVLEEQERHGKRRRQEVTNKVEIIAVMKILLMMICRTTRKIQAWGMMRRILVSKSMEATERIIVEKN
jgi:hypothetical protein